jgi:YfiH family protein
MKIFSDERLMSLGIISGTASRHTGSGRDKNNVNKFFESLNIDPRKILGLNQVHGTEVIKVLTDADLAAHNQMQRHTADAWLLGKSGLGALILTADCVPVFVWDNKGAVVGLAHCGWRGVVSGLPYKIAEMVKENSACGSKLCAYIGPHIKKCCFEVKGDIAPRFSKEAVDARGGKIFVDLSKEIILQLTAAGFKEEDIKQECACNCTYCNRADFFSYRRDGTRDTLISFAYKI